VDISDVIRSRRRALGLSQAEVAKAAGVSLRQFARYEAGEQQPVFSAAVALAEALHISLAQLAGKTSHGIDLSGDWWASWQTYREGEEYTSLQQVRIDLADDDLYQVDATTRGLAVEDGGYLWRGEMRLWDNEILLGWYTAADGAVRSKGTMYFVAHAHGIHLLGRWVGLSYDGKIVTGWAAMAHDSDEPRGLIDTLKASDGKGLPL
jgi:transcriptional regulator with XRE-family HTH domain